MRAFEISQGEEKEIVVLDKILIDGKVTYLIADSKRQIKTVSIEDLKANFLFERVL